MGVTQLQADAATEQAAGVVGEFDGVDNTLTGGAGGDQTQPEASPFATMSIPQLRAQVRSTFPDSVAGEAIVYIKRDEAIALLEGTKEPSEVVPGIEARIKTSKAKRTRRKNKEAAAASAPEPGEKQATVKVVAKVAGSSSFVDMVQGYVKGHKPAKAEVLDAARLLTLLADVM